ncbi:hypothetical protein [uncultured Devosia sp.]|uniref:hypothetical protein n=1 Tax=uncultured Devosia sp. TaxID=211434 RepID=UPI0035C9DBA2
MASILSLGTKMFRTRNSARDSGTDMDRFMTVRRSVEAAIESATRERRGLQQRVDVYYAQATSLLDNSAEFGQRSDQDEDAIGDAEKNAATARARIRQISAHIDQLNAMLSGVDAALNSEPA